MAGRIAKPLKFSLLLSAALLAGCGGGGSDPAPKPKPKPKEARKATPTPKQQTTPNGVLRDAAPGKVKIVRAWVDALRAGQVNRAASYFAVPAIVQNGEPQPVELRDRRDVRIFNESLPCGARFVNAVTSGGRYTIVTFELTERKGRTPGCGAATGNLAATAFAFRKGKISEWVRVVVPPTPQET